ncbi:hypothetical protein QN277_014877 [Acacia crassicarpa]|uniref:C2H2-type domain-containing protein n=1 Tax=Acacia crassicarpa TaxID=499986 RepID=A0AAE1JX25_9FABA|nr:hypothetical protein QN277_014877 [Acacia crassicarpa]
MSKPRIHRKSTKQATTNQNQKPQKSEKQPSWVVVRGLLTCRNVQTQPQQKQPQQIPEGKQQPKKKQEQRKLQEERVPEDQNSKKCKKMKCSGSLCNNTNIMAKPETGCPDSHNKKPSLSACSSSNNDSTSRSMKAPPREPNAAVLASSSLSASSSSSVTGSFKGMPFRRLSGCYECRMVVDPVLGFTRDPSLRSSICPCPDCGEIFTKTESLELHQAVKHAVSELGPEDTSKNIVEIIFHSSWLKKQSPVCKIDRILKVQNTQKTISKFEEYRDSIKTKATNLPKKHPRCIADGNELLRFHATTFVCSLGLNGSSNLCNSISQCNVCNIIKNGFKVAAETTNGENDGKGILTTATSGKAHDRAVVSGDEKNDVRAMLVCRVIAGRVKKNMEGSMEEYDSIGGGVGAYSNLDELYVFNPRAILPCFVVIYRGF